MADKVEQLMEKMVDELLYYKQEEIFSTKEVRKLVTTRRSHEYQLQRKDADVSFFLDAINYEKKIERVKTTRKKKLGKARNIKYDNDIKRRIMHIYDRSCRKYKQNKILWKEYLHYLVKIKSMQKLNKVLTKCLQFHPDVLDFWLIGTYAELDIRGNLFSSRNLMLQAIRANEKCVEFYVAYLEFELNFLNKIMSRRQIL